MSKEKKITTCYAHVLLTHAIQKGILQPIHQSTTFLQKQFKRYPILDRMLCNPTVPYSIKRQLLKTFCCAKVNPDLWKFLDIMLEQHHIHHLKAVVPIFHIAYDGYMGIQDVTLTTAVAIPDTLTTVLSEKIKQWIRCKEIRLTKQIDPAIIGGYSLKMGSFQLNKTIKHYLSALKSHFQAGL